MGKGLRGQNHCNSVVKLTDLVFPIGLKNPKENGPLTKHNKLLKKIMCAWCCDMHYSEMPDTLSEC